MATSLPTGTVTFLFTDIEGSTRIAREQREAWPNLQKRHHAILRSAIQAHNGYIFQTVGDAFCAAFQTAREALDAALEAQRSLQAEEWGQAPIKVRMGINTGAAQAEIAADGSADYSGYATLVRAQRVMSTAYGGQILLSHTSADLIADELPEGVSLRDMKEHRLKGLANPERLQQVMAPDLEQDFPALQTLDGIPNNLPIQLTSFIGREKEIAAIKDLLGRNRLVTLTGSGGVGKTRHCLQAAAEMLEQFGDGVWLVELAAVSDPALVPQAVARPLGLREDETRPLIASLGEHLEARTELLVLDNCEHLLQGCAALVDALLPACPNLKILISSREALGTAGEVAYRVPSLSLPDPDNLPPPENLSKYDSVRLFMDRALAVKSDFVVTPQNALAVVQICSRLDGIPLAIELAAARVSGLPPEQIAQRLNDRFRLLTGGRRTGLPRHQTLRAMIGWSYDLLSAAERTLLPRFGVFVGDWSLEAAEAVCADDGPSQPTGASIAAADVLDLLLRLVDKSLVVSEDRGGQARFRMMETIREFVREKLAESGGERPLRARHLEFFLRFSEQAEARLEGPDPLLWLNELGAEYENLRLALDWAREEGSPQPALRLAMATEQLADVQFLLRARTKAMPLYQRAIDMWQGVEGADPMIAARLHGKILRTAASLKLHVDAEQFKPMLQIAAASRTAVTSALAAAGAGPASLEKVRLLTALAEDAARLRVPADWELAERYARDAVQMAEQLQTPVALSAALGTLAEVLFYRGSWRERAQVTARRVALSAGAQFGSMQERAIALIDAGEALQYVGEYDQSLALIHEGESLAAQMHAPELEKWALEQKLHNLLRLDRWDEVLGLSDKLRDLQRRYPLERIGPSCYSISAVAAVHAFRGELDIARDQSREADAIMTGVMGSHDKWGREQHY